VWFGSGNLEQQNFNVLLLLLFVICDGRENMKTKHQLSRACVADFENTVTFYHAWSGRKDYVPG
jgi:hypothetical protein